MQALRHLGQRLLGAERLTFLFTLTELIGRLDNMDAKTEKILAENEQLRIMYDHFMDQYKDESQAFAAINHIGEQVKAPGCKLIHIEDTVFLIAVTAARMVEMHAMMGGHPTEDEKLKKLDGLLDKLLPMLKEVDVKIAYTYMPPEKVEAFRSVLEGHKFYERPAEVEGKKYVVFYVEV
jgi:hypothetical protein